jgi:hypothetical protein
MMDRRSSSDARVWVGGDGRVHREATNPPLSVFSVLDTWAWDVAEQRGFDHRQLVSVEAVCRWLDNQLDWICRHEAVADFHEDVRKLLGQLRPVTGDRCIQIGDCPECDTALFAPLQGDTITCVECGESWNKDRWLALAERMGVDQDDFVSTAGVSVRYNITISAVRSRASKEKWTPYGPPRERFWSLKEVRKSFEEIPER